MNDYLVALLLGFSFGNLWLCAILVFSLQTTNRSTCGGYLLGRFVAICILSVVVAAVGKFVSLDRNLLNVLSGLLLLAFSLYLAVTRILNWKLPWSKPHVHEGERPDQCSGICNICVSEEAEFEPITRQARIEIKRTVNKGSVAGFSVGMSIGAIRGASMCGKLAILVPILLNVPIFKAFAIGLIFSLSSSIYPLLGFALGAFAVRLLSYKKWLFGISCAFLAVFGLRYIALGLEVWRLP